MDASRHLNWMYTLSSSFDMAMQSEVLQTILFAMVTDIEILVGLKNADANNTVVGLEHLEVSAISFLINYAVLIPQR